VATPRTTRATREGAEVSERAAAYLAATTFETVSLSNLGAVIGAVRDVLTDVDGAFRQDMCLGQPVADLSGRSVQERSVPVGAEVYAYGVFDVEQRGLLPDLSTGTALRLVSGRPATAMAAARRKARGHLLTGTLLLALLIGATVGVTAQLSPSFGEALIAAAGSDDLEALQGLLEAGADVDSRGVGGETALMFAPTQSTARLLVAHGADVNAADLGGHTPLMRAVERGNRQLVELYLAAGVDLEAINEQRQTALDIAREKGHQELADLLLAASGRSAP